jgi:hypothetical protein
MHDSAVLQGYEQVGALAGKLRERVLVLSQDALSYETHRIRVEIQ